jgi:hypothetical protein
LAVVANPKGQKVGIKRQHFYSFRAELCGFIKSSSTVLIMNMATVFKRKQKHLFVALG